MQGGVRVVLAPKIFFERTLKIFYGDFQNLTGRNYLFQLKIFFLGDIRGTNSKNNPTKDYLFRAVIGCKSFENLTPPPETSTISARFIMSNCNPLAQFGVKPTSKSLS